MKLKKILVCFTTLASFSPLAHAVTGYSNENSQALSPAKELEISDINLTSNPLALNSAGFVLAPKAGHAQILLTGNAGSITSRFSYGSRYGSDTISENDQAVSAAVGVGMGFFVGTQGVFVTQADNNENSNSKTQGLLEPQVAVGYRADLPQDSTFVASISYAIGTGSRKYNQSSQTDSTADAKIGGAAIIPAMQAEIQASNRLRIGARAAYLIQGKVTESSTYQQSASNQTNTGGNRTTLMTFAQLALNNQLALGISAGALILDKTRVQSVDNIDNGVDQGLTPIGSTIPGETLGVVSLNAPIKISRAFDVIPQASYLRSMIDGGQSDWVSVGVSAKFNF